MSISRAKSLTEYWLQASPSGSTCLVLFCLHVVLSFVGGDYCTNTVHCFHHTLAVFMVHFTALRFWWSLHQLKRCKIGNGRVLNWRPWIFNYLNSAKTHNAGSLISFYFKGLGIILMNLNRKVCRRSMQQQRGILDIISAVARGNRKAEKIYGRKFTLKKKKNIYIYIYIHI